MTDRQKAYRLFLQSSFWKELSERVKRKRGRCQKCKKKKRLQAHHIRYPEDWFDTKESDLMVLCRKCHARKHGLISEVMVPDVLYRNDWKFSLIIYRIQCLMNGARTGKKLRPRDERFLENALELYPPTPNDSCIKFKVDLLRDWNSKVDEWFPV